jgi:hypothetical protein
MALSSATSLECANTQVTNLVKPIFIDTFHQLLPFVLLWLTDLLPDLGQKTHGILMNLVSPHYPLVPHDSPFVQLGEPLNA